MGNSLAFARAEPKDQEVDTMTTATLMFVIVEKHSRLLGTSRRVPLPGDTWDDVSGTVHAASPHGRSHTFCGRRIVGETQGWFFGEETDEAGRVTCRTCHTILRKRGEF